MHIPTCHLISKMSTLLYEYPRPLHRAKITARPSASNKSPYLVDVILDDDPTQTPQIAHNPALLCGGRLDKGATIYVMPAPPESKGLSKYLVMLLEAEDTLIMTNTQYGNHIAAAIAKQGYLGWIPDTLKAEATHGQSRFDFGGCCAANKEFFIEVKSAPLLDTDGKAAIFPVGNRKHKADDPVSPRAVKHAEHLTALASTYKTALMYIAMRPDPTHFQISQRDNTYNAAIRKAHAAGVNLYAFSVRPTTEGVYFEKALDVHI
jgi:DNA-binding sugar fermentation-stimulating protein